MLAADVASNMNMSLSAYEKFENGRIRVNADYVYRFADVTNSDHFAIHLAVMLGEPKIALYSSRNHVASALSICLGEACEPFDDWLADVQASDAFTVFSDAFRRLKDLTEQRRKQSRALLDARIEPLVRKRPRPQR